MGDDGEVGQTAQRVFSREVMSFQQQQLAGTRLLLLECWSDGAVQSRRLTTGERASPRAPAGVVSRRNISLIRSQETCTELRHDYLRRSGIIASPLSLRSVQGPTLNYHGDSPRGSEILNLLRWVITCPYRS